MTEKFLIKEMRWRLCEDCHSAMVLDQKPHAWADLSIIQLLITPDDFPTACASCLKSFSSRGYHYIVGTISPDPNQEATGLHRLYPRYIHLFREENTISIDT